MSVSTLDGAPDRPTSAYLVARIGRLPVLSLLAFAAVALGLVMLWTKAQPFTDLQDYATVDMPFLSSDRRKVLTLGLAAIVGLMVAMRGRLGVLWQTVDGTLVAVFVWFAATSLLSAAPGLGLNRLILAGVVVGIAAAIPLLFDRVRDYVAALSAAAVATIALSFAGVLLAPDFAIHSLRDVNEQALAGEWRGVFGHKNDLAPMAVHFAFLGLLLARTGPRAIGLGIIAASLVLLVMSGGKSAMLLVVPSLFLALLMMRTRGRTLGLALVLGSLGTLLLLTLGSVAVAPVQALVAATLPDPTFTGRSEIWDYAMRAIGERPLAGYGYAVFWDSGLMAGIAGPDATVAQVAHSHNGFLETAISGGLPGLALVLVWTAVLPCRDLARVRERLVTARERAFADYLVMSWLFTLLLGALEAVVFNRGEPVWIMGLLAMASLRYWAQAGAVRS